MTSSRKHFRIGEIQCIALNDGTFNYPANWFFSNVPSDQLTASLRDRDLPPNVVVSAYTCLLVRSEKHCVLVDTGADGLAPTTGNLLKNLEAEGIPPEAITHVVLTHAHPDHIGGVLDGAGKPAFSNAQYVMSRTEWDFWTGTPDLRNMQVDDQMKGFVVSCAQKTLPPLKDRIELLECDKEIVAGVHAVAAPGHTPGHMALVISSGNSHLLHVADAVLHPLHMENPGWLNVFDLAPQTASSTRERLLDRAAADGMSMLAFHFSFPGLGHVERKGNSWKWKTEN